MNDARPSWSVPYCKEHDIPIVSWNFKRINDRPAFGTHWGLIYLFGEDPQVMRDLLKHQEGHVFYV